MPQASTASTSRFDQVHADMNGKPVAPPTKNTSMTGGTPSKFQSVFAEMQNVPVPTAPAISSETRYLRPGDKYARSSRDLTPMEVMAETGNTLGKEFVKGGKEVIGGTVDFATRIGRSLTSIDPTALPSALYDAAKGTVSTVAGVPQTFMDWYEGAKTGDAQKMSKSASDFALKEIPAIEGTAGALKGGAGAAKTALRDVAKPAPILTFLRNVPGLAIDQAKLGTGMSVLKDGEAITGKITTDVPTAIQNAKAAQNAIHEHVDSTIRGQESIKVPGSRQAQINAQIKALPETYRPGTKAYTRAVKNIIETVGPNDFTIGELNRLRKDLSATQSPYYGRDLQGQLTMEAGPRAADIARGNTIRQQFYDALNDNGLGGKEIVQEANRRLGALIELQDILNDPLVKNKAALQSGRTGISKIADTLGKLGRPAESLKKYAAGETSLINEDIASALRRWQASKPLGEFATGPRPGTEAPRNAANELIMPKSKEVSGLPAVIPPEPPPQVVKAWPVGDSRFPMPESSIAKNARFNRALTTGQKLLPEAGGTSVKVTPQPSESFSDAMKRTETAQSRLMRETMGKGPFDKQARPATAEEYLQTKSGTDMPNPHKFEAKSKTAPKPEPPKKSGKSGKSSKSGGKK